MDPNLLSVFPALAFLVFAASLVRWWVAYSQTPIPQPTPAVAPVTPPAPKPTPNEVLDFDEEATALFTDVMLDHYPMLRRTAGVSFLFDFFDVNHNNSVDFKEFALGMSRLTRGTLHVRALDLASGAWRGIS